MSIQQIMYNGCCELLWMSILVFEYVLYGVVGHVSKRGKEQRLNYLFKNKDKGQSTIVHENNIHIRDLMAYQYPCHINDPKNLTIIIIIIAINHIISNHNLITRWSFVWHETVYVVELGEFGIQQNQKTNTKQILCLAENKIHHILNLRTHIPNVTI